MSFGDSTKRKPQKGKPQVKRIITSTTLAIALLVGAVGLSAAPAKAAYEPYWVADTDTSRSQYVNMQKCVAYRSGVPYWKVRVQTWDGNWAPSKIMGSLGRATYYMHIYGGGAWLGQADSPNPPTWYVFNLAPGVPEPSGVNVFMPAWGDAYHWANLPGPPWTPYESIPQFNAWKGSQPNTTACQNGSWESGIFKSSWFTRTGTPSDYQ